MITMKDFIAEDDPILRKEAEAVSFPLDSETLELIEKMREFLKNSQDEEIANKHGLRPGVGLAAPQLGVSKQIFAVFLMEYDEEGNPIEPIIDQVFINPKIISHSVQKAALREGEGCLSVPRNVDGYVPRPKRVKITYQDINGEEHSLREKDYIAMVLQHELDHLKGILFYDYINPDNPWHKEADLDLL